MLCKWISGFKSPINCVKASTVQHRAVPSMHLCVPRNSALNILIHFTVTHFWSCYLLFQCDVVFIRFKTNERGWGEREEDKRASGNYVLLINSMGQSLLWEVISRSTSQLNVWSVFSRTCVPILRTSGKLCAVVWRMDTTVSKESASTIFRLK